MGLDKPSINKDMAHVACLCCAGGVEIGAAPSQAPRQPQGREDAAEQPRQDSPAGRAQGGQEAEAGGGPTDQQPAELPAPVQPRESQLPQRTRPSEWMRCMFFY